MNLIISRDRLIVKEIGVVDLIVSRGRLILKEFGAVELIVIVSRGRRVSLFTLRHGIIGY